MKYIYLLLLNIAIVSCTKDKPSIGKYEGFFNGSYIQNDSIILQKRNEILFIRKAYIESLFLSSTPSSPLFSLIKEKNKAIHGVLNVSRTYGSNPGYKFGPIEIDGHWKKEGHVYFINGDFSYTYSYYPVDSAFERHQVDGNFEIKSIQID